MKQGKIIYGQKPIEYYWDLKKFKTDSENHKDWNLDALIKMYKHYKTSP